MFSKFSLAVLRINCSSVSVKPHLFTCFLFISVSFCGFPFLGGVGHNPCTSPSINTNINPWAWLMNCEFFFILRSSPQSQCTAASPCDDGWVPPMPISGIIHNSASFPWGTPDEDLCLQMRAFLRKKSVLAWWDLPALHPAVWTGEWQLCSVSLLPRTSLFLLRTDSSIWENQSQKNMPQ